MDILTLLAIAADAVNETQVNGDYTLLEPALNENGLTSTVEDITVGSTRAFHFSIELNADTSIEFKWMHWQLSDELHTFTNTELKLQIDGRHYDAFVNDTRVIVEYDDRDEELQILEAIESLYARLMEDV